MFVLICPGWADLRDSGEARRLDDQHDWVRREVETALARHDAIVVPVLHDGAAMPMREELPETMRRLCECNAVTITGKDVYGEIDRLIESVQTGRLRGLAKESLADGGRLQ
jgi:hypothetical protein